MSLSTRGAEAAPLQVTGPAFPAAIRVVDSHTEGEPTRVVVDGWPQPAGRTMAERRERLRREFDHLRASVVLEPRGHAAIVGALLTPPVEPGSAAGVVFFNNVGYLGMCGHGLIGVVTTLHYLGRLGPGVVRIDTPVGTVGAELGADGAVTIENVPAYCHALDVAVEVPGLGRVVGDVAWGGNWFFITHLPGLSVELPNLDALYRATRAILAALREQGITGKDGAEIDHVELSAPPRRADADCRNFVLCPGGEYDRSPCGTGTSAKMATLHARGELALGAPWRQESITGSLFHGWLTAGPAGLVPHIRGRAFVTGEATLRFDPADPFQGGLVP
ncbi:MAG: proline racemase family protein [Gemmatimonadetes bacterium]|nr:proline racemase family protein [Gemmatimonadota bacterium]